jgi:hypothetical protein
MDEMNPARGISTAQPLAKGHELSHNCEDLEIIDKIGFPLSGGLDHRIKRSIKRTQGTD